MKTRYRPERPFRAHNSMAPTNRYFPKTDEAHTLAEEIVDAIREPLVVLDEERRVVTANRSFRELFDDQRDVQGRSFWEVGDGRLDTPELRLLLANVLPTEVCEVEADVPEIGRRTMLLNARNLFHQRDDHASVLLTIEDVTGQRADERQMAELLHHKEVLLQEMQHRTANSLQIIASILLLKARAVQSEEARLPLKDAHQRIMSIAAVQQQLGITGQEGQIDLAPYLSRLCETLAAALVGESRPIAIKAQAYDARTSSAAVVSIGLIVTELVINALKHAFVADTAAGLIVVSYEAGEAGWRLAVSDNGIGQSECHTDKAGPGLGTGIVEALARQLEGRVKISMGSNGTSVSITHGTLSSRLPHAAWYQHPQPDHLLPGRHAA